MINIKFRDMLAKFTSLFRLIISCENIVLKCTRIIGGKIKYGKEKKQKREEREI